MLVFSSLQLGNTMPARSGNGIEGSLRDYVALNAFYAAATGSQTLENIMVTRCNHRHSIIKVASCSPRRAVPSLQLGNIMPARLSIGIEGFLGD